MALLGSSFTRWRAEALGLDCRRAFARLCDLRFDLIRLSCSWREIHDVGWTHLDWLMAHAEAAHQPVMLTVGMKALGWPEFYLPGQLDPSDNAVPDKALAHITATVDRYGGYRMLRHWQVENEPFNRSGPQARCIPRVVVRREVAAIRAQDPSRALALTCFGHFNRDVDRASRRLQPKWKEALGLELSAEREALSVLRPGEILGLDLYRAIGWIDPAGEERVSYADDDQVAYLRRWQRIATDQRKRLWITEAQAEPWEARWQNRGNPRTLAPDDLLRLMRDVAQIEAVLLWGSEYWLWRAEQGDSRWIDAVRSFRNGLVPAVSPV